MNLYSISSIHSSQFFPFTSPTSRSFFANTTPYLSTTNIMFFFSSWLTCRVTVSNRIDCFCNHVYLARSILLGSRLQQHCGEIATFSTKTRPGDPVSPAGTRPSWNADSSILHGYSSNMWTNKNYTPNNTRLSTCRYFGH